MVWRIHSFEPAATRRAGARAKAKRAAGPSAWIAAPARAWRRPSRATRVPSRELEEDPSLYEEYCKEVAAGQTYEVP